jgi:phage/plasmid-associated DNA primase
VEDATREYRLEQDRLEQWLEERCLISAAHRQSSAELYSDYSEWCQQLGERAESMRTWSRRMTAAGFGASKANSTAWREGLRIANAPEREAGWTGRRKA